MNIIVFPLPKGPHQKGRYGPTEEQDWYCGCKKAVALEHDYLRTGDSPTILVLSGFHYAGDEAEADVYSRTLRTLGAQYIEVVRKGHETIEQLEWAHAYATKEDALLHIIASPTHYLRIRYLMRGKKATYSIAYGIPRPRELCTDLVLVVLFPLIDLLGGRKWWLRLVQSRRKSGQF